MVLFGFTEAAPCDVVPTDATVSTSPSASLSFASAVIVTTVLSGVVAESFVATGAALLPVNGAPEDQLTFVPTRVPVIPLPELSPTTLPLPSFIPHRPRRPDRSEEHTSE